jgi:hypothetical protein
LNKNDSSAFENKSDDHVEMKSNGSSNEVSVMKGHKKAKNKFMGRNYKLDRKNP